MISKPPCLTDEFWELCILQRQFFTRKYPHLYGSQDPIQSAPTNPHQHSKDSGSLGHGLLPRDGPKGDRG